MIAYLRTLSIALCLTLPVCATAEFHFDARNEKVVADEDKQLATAISGFLDRYYEAYDIQDFRTLKTMWHDDGNPIYMAEEVPFPIYGKAGMDKYFNPAPGKRILAGIDNRHSEVRAKYITPDVAVATYRLDYDIKLTGMPAVGGWDRAIAMFVNTDDGWKLTAYAEAPMGPATMVRKMIKANPAGSDTQKADYATTVDTIRALSQASVSEEFDEFVEARKDIEPTH